MAEMVHFCAACKEKVTTGIGTWKFCPACGAELEGRTFARPLCANYSPPSYRGHWIDWHRGHGCHLDDGKPRKPAATAEIASMGRTR